MQKPQHEVAVSRPATEATEGMNKRYHAMLIYARIYPQPQRGRNGETGTATIVLIIPCSNLHRVTLCIYFIFPLLPSSIFL